MIDPLRPSVLYATTPYGVHRSIDAGVSWTPVSDGLSGIPINDLALDPAPPSTLYAATEAGVFEIDLVTRLELHDGRFEVEVEWRDVQAITGPGTVANLAAGDDFEVELRSQDSAVVEFFDRDNWELLVKVLDGRSLNGNFWVFLAGATDVAYTTTVTDTRCGQVRTYANPLGTAAPAVTDDEAFPGCAAPVPASCEPGDGVLCLGEDGRFRVESAWADFAGGSGVGRQVSVPAGDLARSDDSGMFYFFSRDNWELLVKVLDGCDLNGHFWTFAAAGTDVEYRLKVTDTATGTVKTYANPLGTSAAAVTDTTAFATCGAG